MDEAADKLDRLDQSALEEFNRLFADGATNEQIQSFIANVFQSTPPGVLAEVTSGSPRMLKGHRKQLAKFRTHCVQKWKEPLDLLWTLFLTIQEVTEAHAHSGPRDADPIVFDTLAHLNPRALLIVSEILCLLEGGFADGALARWRSLHETVVVAKFIATHGKSVATDYRAAKCFEDYKAAKWLNEVADRAGIPPITELELKDLEARADAAKSEIGRSIDSDWDWAAPTLGKEKRVQFREIELAVGLDHWRPRYRWASHRIHAPFRDPNDLLGRSEANDVRFLTGPSSAGFVDPLHMTAVSLIHMATIFLAAGTPNLDRQIYIEVFKALSDKVGEAAIKVVE